MKYFFCKLVPPRSSFAQDMSADEAKVMQAHGLYWREKAKTQTVLAIGLVGDPRGFYGVGILGVEDEAELKSLLDKDPATSVDGMKYETYPMPLGVVHT